jgi:predicted metalloendopeptidase
MKNNMQDNMALLLRDRGPDNRARREATVAMVQEMTAAAADEIDEVRHWPGLDDADARAKLQAHIRAIDVSVGFPAALRAVAYGLRADDGVAASMLRVGRQNAREVLASVRAQPREFLWVMNPLTANACYNISTHSIIITEAMTLPPFFGQGARFITGHEITHSIDDQGAAKIAEMPAAAREGFAALCQRMVAWNRALKRRWRRT